MSIREVVHCDHCNVTIGPAYDMDTINKLTSGHIDDYNMGGVYFGEHGVSVFWTQDTVWCTADCFFKWVKERMVSP